MLSTMVYISLSSHDIRHLTAHNHTSLRHSGPEITLRDGGAGFGTSAQGPEWSADVGQATLHSVLAHGGRACRGCTRVFDSLLCQIGNLAVDRRVAGEQTMWWQCAQGRCAADATIRDWTKWEREGADRGVGADIEKPRGGHSLLSSANSSMRHDRTCSWCLITF